MYMLWGVDAYKKDRQPSPGTPLGIPEDRLHEYRQGTYPSRNTRGQTTSTTDSLPLEPLSEYQRTDYVKDRQAFPWYTHLGMPEDRLHVG